MALQVTDLPAVPSRNSAPDTFSDDADLFLGALPVFRTELNAVANEVETSRDTATTAATTATTQAGVATTQAGIATTQAGIATTKAAEANADATVALDSANEFRGKYLGSKATDPTLDNQGGALIEGALYFNTTIDLMRVYNGATWQDASSSVNGTANRYNYTATAGQTTFAATYDIGYVDVYFNGIRLINGDDFTATNGTTVVLTVGADAGDSVYIIGFGNFLFSKPIPNEIGNGNKLLTTDGLAVPTLSWTDRTRLAAGTAALPTYSFSLDTDTGAYSPGANTWAVAAGGTKIIEATTTGASITGTLSVSGQITGNLTGAVTGNASTVTNGVYTTGDQTVAGIKTFSSTPRLTIDVGMEFYRISGTNYAGMRALGASGNVVISTGISGVADRFTFDVSGNFTATANVTAYSDERLKRNWAGLPMDFVERLASIKHGTYERIDNGERQVGVSAQSLRELLPEAVLEDEGGTLSVAYGNAALVAAVKLAERIVELEARLALLENK